MRRSLAAIVALGISAAGLWYACRGVDWAEVRHWLRMANYFYVFPMVLIGVGSFYVRALRWKVLLRPLGDFPTGTLFSSTAIGLGFCNMVLPGRVGELVKPYLLSRWCEVPLSGLLGTSLMERLFDMLTILFALGLVVVSQPVDEQLRAWAVVPFALAGILLGTTILLQRRHRLVVGLAERIVGLMPGSVRPRALDLMNGFIGGLEALGSVTSLLKAAALSFVLWGMIASVFGMGFLALGIDVPLVWGSVVVVVSVAVAVAAPSTPGFLGTFQAGCQLALGIYDISPSQALGYSVFEHAIQFLSQVALGAVCLVHRGVAIQEIRRVEKAG